MTTKRNIITVLIMLSLSLGLYASGNEETNSVEESISASKLQVFSGEEIIDEFNIIRKTKLGRDYFEIVSTTESAYLVKSFDLPNGYSESISNTINYNGDITNTEILSCKSVSFPQNQIQHTVMRYTGVELTDESFKQGFYLMNVNNPAESYEIALEIFPSIMISNEDLSDVESLQQSLENNSDYSYYFKTQVLGSSFFNPTENNPFPISDIDNRYTYKLQRNNEYTLTRTEEKYDIGYFDAIYNYSYNNQLELGNSLIQKFLSVYFSNNKPLFHHYIHEYMEENGYNFDYNQYEPIDIDEGKALVEKALTYLTWGVEHTSEKNHKELTEGENIYPSQMIKDGTNVKTWLSKENTTGVRTKNYLQYDPSSITNVVNEKDISVDSAKIEHLKSIAGEYFQATPSKLEGIDLTTPFKSGGTTITGSALPYVKGGMDSPRTFNYKILAQYEIISDYLGNDNTNYKSWYGKNENGWKINKHFFSLKGDGTSKSPRSYYFYFDDNFPTDAHKPFVPGYDRDNNYYGMNLAGVDSLGLLTGALAMTDFYDKVLGLTNNQKSKSLDDYYSMVLESPNNTKSYFHDNEGLPSFHTTTFDDTYKSNYNELRFNRDDLERSTIIVPNLKDMQPGDLLVNTSDNETEVAIVVDTGYSEGDEYFHLSNVLVLTVNEKDKRVSLNFWANGATYSSFTDRPKDFLVRRIIKLKEDVTNYTAFGEDDAWDPFSKPLENIKTHITYNDTKNYGRWIPNTGEMFVINKIDLLKDDESLGYGYSGIPVVLSGLTDINYSSDDQSDGTGTSGSNVNINRGDGFEFYAIDKVDSSYNYIPLAVFNLNSSSQSGSDRYTVNYNQDVFNSDGSAKDSFSLIYNGTNIQFSYSNGDVATNTFGIRPLRNNIRPGDDISLNLDLLINDDLVAATGTDENSIAVYDKKMIWRANLYIKETSNDWNDNYPWNAPSTGDVKGAYAMDDSYSVSFKEFLSGTTELTEDTDAYVFYGNNEWNRVHDGTTAFDLITDLIAGNGKQVIEISDYLNIRGKNETADDKLITDKVAYSYPDRTTVDINSDDWDPAGHMDSPFDFNKKLVKQSVVQSKWYNSDGKKYKKSKDEWPQNITTASDFESKEVFEEYVFDLEEDADYTTQKIDGIFHPKKNTGWYEYVTENGSNNVYLPGLGLYYLDNHNHAHIDVQDGDNIVIPTTASNTQIEAGTDCIGFAQRTASYSGNTYDWPDLPDGYAESGNIINDNSNRSYPYLINSPSGAYSWKISSHGDLDDDIPLYLEKISPGDILFYTWNTEGVYDPDEGGGRHIAVISEIFYDDDMQTDISSINLIESSYNTQEKAYILKEYTINRYSELNRNWFVVRVKH